MTAVSFEVRGVPAPQGSKRAFVRGGRAMLVESSARVAPWRQDVRAAALAAWPFAGPVEGPVSVDVAFAFPRPASHRGRHGLLRSAPAHKSTAPDLDKLVRSTLDALTAVCWADDRQVVAVHATKQWADDESSPCPPGGGAFVTIEVLP